MRTRSDEEILRGYLLEGRLRTIPSKVKRKLVVFNWIAQMFAPETLYDESEVNRVLLLVHEDFATLRRDLCDYGFMGRGDGKYWRIVNAQPSGEPEV
jgi:hypothetical protein